MESSSLKYHQGLDLDVTMQMCSVYGGTGAPQTAQAPYYCSNPYPSSYEPSGLSGAFVTHCTGAVHSQPFTSQATDLCDLDLICLDRQSNLDDLNSQQRRESFSSSCESSSSTGSTPPPPSSMHQMETPPYIAYGGYSNAYNSGCSTSGHAGFDAGMRSRAKTLSSGGYPHRRQNKKERQVQMENEERELTTSIAQLRGVLSKLQRKYDFLEQRVKSRILQAAQPMQSVLIQQQVVP